MTFLLAALAGLLVGVAPVSLPLYSAMLGGLAGRLENAMPGASPPAERWPALLAPLGFVLGIATADAILGALFALFGTLILRVLSAYLGLLNLLLALLLLSTGLVMMRLLRIPWLRLRGSAPTGRSVLGAYLAGIPFGLSTCPACTPLTLPVLLAAGAAGDPWSGGLLLFVFGIARGLPLLLAGGSAVGLARSAALVRMLTLVEYGAGVLLLLGGTYFLYQSAVFAGLLPPLSFLF